MPIVPSLNANETAQIPVIDLFAGPGGLGEGFASLESDSGDSVFSIVLSVENDPVAHRTLTLRSFFRKFQSKETPNEYYQYIRGEIVRDELFALYPEQALKANEEAWCETLGSGNELNQRLDERIETIAASCDDRWVLVGGPPCQAYSTAGRSRRRKITDYKPDEDNRNFLYKEYLRILSKHRPAIFVMENVKGMLSFKINGASMFEMILNDLRRPSLSVGASENLEPEYNVYSLSVLPKKTLLKEENYNPSDYIIESERYGIPQTRHRVILLGIKADLSNVHPDILSETKKVTTKDVIGGLPRLRSGLSREKDNLSSWRYSLTNCIYKAWFRDELETEGYENLKMEMIHQLSKICSVKLDRGGEFIKSSCYVREDLSSWYLDERIEGVCNHMTRSHMVSDLYRYLFLACFIKMFGRSPLVRDLPSGLLPNHKNANAGVFEDRFKVHAPDKVAGTITSHISKDGHYYIHYDPIQCRSLTVREAARLQTFPDNYFFEGNRTEQYKQVGNAVPPLLAMKIAKIVKDILVDADSRV